MKNIKSPFFVFLYYKKRGKNFNTVFSNRLFFDIIYKIGYVKEGWI